MRVCACANDFGRTCRLPTHAIERPQLVGSCPTCWRTSHLRRAKATGWAALPSLKRARQAPLPLAWWDEYRAEDAGRQSQGHAQPAALPEFYVLIKSSESVEINASQGRRQGEPEATEIKGMH